MPSLGTKGAPGVLGMALGLVAGGAAAGIAVQRIAVHRALGRRDDPYREEPFGTLRGAPHPVRSDDGLLLHVEVDEPDGAADADPITVIFSHGYALNLDCWYFQRQGLRDTARLVFWDQRSHGRSARSSVGRATIEQTGRDLGRVIDEVAPRGRLVLVGHSMGGMTVMSLAEQRPELFAERVAGVALLATSAADVPETLPGLRGIPGRVVHGAAPGVLAVLSRRADLVERGRAIGSDLGLGVTRRYSFASDVPASFVEWTAQMIDATPIDVVADFFPDLVRHNRLPALAVLVGTPALVVVGRQDRVLPLRHSEAIARALPHAKLVILEPGGHMLLFEHHDVVTDELSALIAEVGLRTDPTVSP